MKQADSTCCRSLRYVGAAIALMLDGCALGTRNSVAPPPLPSFEIPQPEEPTMEDADPLSQTMTKSIASLLAADLAEEDLVTNALGVDWSLVTEDAHVGGIYSGRAKELPLARIHYEQWLIAPQKFRLTMKLTHTHCYDARALVFNFAPGHVDNPYSVADGEEAGITRRSYFVANNTKVFLAYRRGLSNERDCVAEIDLFQPAN